MTPTPITLLQRAAEHGLKLGSEGRHTLTVEPAERCPPSFADTLKDHKWLLLDLLRLPFVMVYSERMGETIFFCDDEHGRAALVEAGACEWSIYTREELRILCGQNRIAPLSDADLRQLHDGRRVFNARIVE